MHLHTDYLGPDIIEPTSKLKSMDNQQMLADSTFAYMKKYNFVKAVTDCNYALAYQKHDPKLIIPVRTGYHMLKEDPIDSLRKWFQAGTYKVMAEFSPQYFTLFSNPLNQMKRNYY